MGKHYWIDIRHCFTVEQLNPNNVLEYFSTFSSLDPVTLCSTVIEMIPEERPYWTHASAVVCQMNFITFDEWETMMQKDNCMCDELMVFMLSRMHYCHTMIYTANRVWCTIRNIEGMDNSEIHSKCDIHLVYLGNNTYSELKRKPMTPAPPRSLQALPVIDMQKGKGRSKGKGKGKTSKKSTPDKPLDLSATLSSSLSCDPDICFNQSTVLQTDPSITFQDNIGMQTWNMAGDDPTNETAQASTSQVVTSNVGVSFNQSNTMPHASTSQVITSNIGGCFNQSKHVSPLEDLVVKSFTDMYLGLDPYVLCNKYLTLKTGLCTPDTLSTICQKELSKTYSDLEIEKELVELDKKEKRNINLEALLKTLSLKRKVTVTVPKLKCDVINIWMKKVPLWKDTDPYSSLEEIMSSDDDGDKKPKTDREISSNPDEGLHFSRIGGHCLRTSEQSYYHERHRRSSTESKFYCDMCTEPAKHKPRISPAVLCGPSKGRLTAQKKAVNSKGATVNQRLTRSYPLFQTIKHKPNKEATYGFMQSCLVLLP